MGRRQTHVDQGLYAVPRPLGAPTLVEGNRPGISHFGEKVFDAVEYVVAWGLEHRTLGQVDAIGVDEIQYAKGHKYLTLVYQIDIGITRLLWVGKERTIESFQGFFATMGDEIISKIFICSDMWEPYLKVIRENAARPCAFLIASTSWAQNEQGARRGSRRGSIVRDRAEVLAALHRPRVGKRGPVRF